MAKMMFMRMLQLLRVDPEEVALTMAVAVAHHRPGNRSKYESKLIGVGDVRCALSWLSCHTAERCSAVAGRHYRGATNAYDKIRGA